MGRILLMFFGLWGAWYMSITIVRHLDGEERWALTKTLMFSAVCAFLSLVTMVVFVLLF
jgi:hypothetical protein